MVQIKNPAEFNERYAQFVHPIMEAALAWYNSSDYEPLKQLRLNEVTSRVLVTGIIGGTMLMMPEKEMAASQTD